MACRGRVGVARRWNGIGRARLLLRLCEVVQEFSRIARPVPNDWRCGRANHLLEPPPGAVHCAGDEKAVALAEPGREIERAGRGRTTSQDVECDGTDREHVDARDPFVGGAGGLGRHVDLGWIGEVVVDMWCAGRHRCADARALASARHLPVGDLQSRVIAVWIAHQDALRCEPPVIEPLAVRVGHRLASWR